MRRRGFSFLLTAGVALIAATVVALVLSGRSPIPHSPPKPVFPGLADRVGELAWARVSRGATKIDFANVAGRWVVVEKDNYPADPAKLRRLFAGLAGLTLIEPGTPDADRSARTDRGGTAGGEPTLIALRGRTGDTVAEAIVAPAPNAATGDAGVVYVRRPGAEPASLALGSLELPGDTLGWLDRDIIDLPQTRIASLKLTGADGATLAIGRDGPDTPFAIADLPQGARLKPDAGLADLAGILSGLAFDDVKPRALVELPDSGLIRAAFVTFDGIAIELRLFAYQGADWIAVASSGTGAAEAESKALNDKLARWVYAIPAARAKKLRTRLDDVTEPAKGP
jgi:hypothetical protein